MSGASRVRPAAVRGILAALGAGLPLALLAGLSACSGSGGGAHATVGAAAATSPVAVGSGPAVALQQQFEAVIRTVLPSVVQINTSNSTGSGVIYDDKGDIVTNAHVVGNAQTLQVAPATGGGVLTAHVVGAFTPDDLAVIRVTSGASELHHAAFGNSQDVTAGQIVLAMGNPLGLTGSATQGIISATDRTVSEAGSSPGAPSTTIAGALQTSAAINGGNSGGALVNLAGQVIGIPTAAARDPEAGAAPGIGFAIPSDTVTNIADQLISTGRVTNSGRAALGIQAHTAVTAAGQPAGVAVAEVTPNGPAASAGLRAGDVIVAVDGQQTATQSDLTAILATLKPGQQVPVTFVRSDSRHTATVTLGSLSS